jgi:hypothetical protein
LPRWGAGHRCPRGPSAGRRPPAARPEAAACAGARAGAGAADRRPRAARAALALTEIHRNRTLKFIAHRHGRRPDGKHVVGGAPSIAFAADGNPVISYFDPTAGVIVLAFCGAPDCASAPR